MKILIATHNPSKLKELSHGFFCLTQKNITLVSLKDLNIKQEPEEIGKTKASEIVELLEKGLADLKARPEHFEKFNSPNGWGMYEHFVPFVEKYLQACKEYPDAVIEVSR